MSSMWSTTLIMGGSRAAEPVLRLAELHLLLCLEEPWRELLAELTESFRERFLE